ncbi:MAG: hypothetical protein ABSD68_01460 [Candidatus Micrarchaeales archaeon]|jgi:hypothetical protein
MNFVEIANKIKKLSLPLGEYALFGSVPLAAHGIRESRDIDIVAMPKLYNRLRMLQGWKEGIFPSGDKVLRKDDVEMCKDWNYKSYNPSVKKLITEADIIDGIPVVKLEETLAWKKAFGREKDLKDVKLIEKYFSKKKENQ